MIRTQQFNNQDGFTLIEMIVVMVIIAAILSAILPAFTGAQNNSKVASAVSTIRALQTAATNYYSANGGTYTGGTIGTISLANLTANNMLPVKAAGSNPWGGSIAIAPDANANYVDISFVGVPSSIQGQISTAVSNFTQTTPSYTSGTSTWTAGF